MLQRDHSLSRAHHNFSRNLSRRINHNLLELTSLVTFLACFSSAKIASKKSLALF